MSRCGVFFIFCIFIIISNISPVASLISPCEAGTSSQICPLFLLFFHRHNGNFFLFEQEFHILIKRKKPSLGSRLRRGEINTLTVWERRPISLPPRPKALPTFQRSTKTLSTKSCRYYWILQQQTVQYVTMAMQLVRKPVVSCKAQLCQR